MPTLVKNIYYHLKPLIPRPLQLKIRRKIISIQKEKYKDIWPIDERAATPPKGWKGWPDGKRFALVLTHDVETEKGLDNCRKLAELEKGRGFTSSFNFVAEDYKVPQELRQYLTNEGFEVGVHGLSHDGKLYSSRETFKEQAKRINHYLKEWKSAGFRSPSMHHNLQWLHDLNIEYDASTFDTDPFEPIPAGMKTIYPFWVNGNSRRPGYVELPYTLPQDFTLFILMREGNIDIWKKKLDWIVKNGGMVLLDSHPDYMQFDDKNQGESYPGTYYFDLLKYIKTKYEGQYFHVLPEDIARFWSRNYRDESYTSGYTNRRIKACMLAYTFYDSDARVRRYAESLVKRGDKVDVIALRKDDQPKYEVIKGVNVYRIQHRNKNEQFRVTYLFRLLRFFVHSAIFLGKKSLSNQYDIVHVHSVPDFEVFAAFIPKLMGARVILDIHDIVPEFYSSKFKVKNNSIVFNLLLLIERISSAFSDHIIIANHIWEKTITSRSVNRDKCTTLINYPDISIFNNSTDGKPDDKFIMLYPGTLNWHQGLDIAIRAFYLIKDEVPNAELHIHGEGPSKGLLIKLIDELNLRDRVFLKEFLPLEKISKIMSEAHLGIVPKRASSFGNEAFSTKILEFMALGVPVLIADTKIDRYYFNDSVVMFFKAEDEKDMAKSMLLLIKDKELRKRLVMNASKYINENNWTIKQSEYYKLVDSLTAYSYAST